MGFRFKKSFKLLSGVRLNLSRSGTSVSVGVPGATQNFSSRGVRTTLGLPGTGISYTNLHRTAAPEVLSAAAKAQPRAADAEGAEQASRSSSPGAGRAFRLLLGAALVLLGAKTGLSSPAGTALVLLGVVVAVSAFLVRSSRS